MSAPALRIFGDGLTPPAIPSKPKAPVDLQVSLAAGNVAAFLPAAELEFVFVSAATLLNPAGYLIIVTTVEAR